jgi:hypothetical protein
MKKVSKKTVVAKKPAAKPKKIPKLDLGTCSVCFDDFKDTAKIVICPFCPSKCCTECSQEYLIGSSKAAHCMSCKKEWPAIFFSKTFSKSFRLGPYVEHRKKIFLEEQTAALPATLPLVEAKKKEEALKEEIKILTELLAKMEKEADTVFENIRVGKQILKNGVAAGTKKMYMFKCPKVASETTDKETKEKVVEMCRGFIEKDTHMCTLCKTKICEKCHLVVDLEKTGRPAVDHVVDGAAKTPKKIAHVCKKEDVETAKMVLADTKPCPTCSSRIFKTEGCDQMFCTQCQTAFSWNTGNIETGTIHNPHYYELMRKLGNNRRVAGDVPCGGLTDARHLICHDISRDVQNLVLNIHRRCAEVSAYIRNRNREVLNHEEIRLRYLMGKLTPDQFREAVYERSCLIEKRREELQILSTFEAAVIERINKLSDDARDVSNRKILRSEYEKEQREKARIAREEEGEGSEDEESDEEEEAIEYEKLKVPQLKEILRERGLPLGGIKVDLINRLKASDAGEEIAVAAPVLPIRRERPAAKRRHHRRGKVRASVKNAPAAPRKGTSIYMALPAPVRRKQIEELFLELAAEVDKIVEFCNKAFKDNFTAMGYEDYPVLVLNEEYIFPRPPPGEKKAPLIVGLPRPHPALWGGQNGDQAPRHRMQYDDTDDSDSSDF